MGLIVYNPVDSAKFNVPVGTYLAKFVGTADKKPFDDPRFLKPGEQPRPRMGWRFEVVGPPGNTQVGQVIEQETGTYPSAKSGLVRLLNMMLANHGGLQPAQSVDPASFVGRVYQVQWTVNPSSEKGNPHIAALMEVQAGLTQPAPARAQAAPQQPAAWTPPPPPKRTGQGAPAPAVQRYGVSTPTGVVMMTQEETQSWIHANHRKAADVDVCAEGSDSWKTGADFGFDDALVDDGKDVPY